MTSIEWADETWNPILGCSRVSKGCDNCYAITTAHIRVGHPNPKISTPFIDLTARTEGRLDWTGQINMLPERLHIPMRWRKPRRIFVNSQSDLFADGVSDDFIVQVLAVMAVTPQHTYQVLTKRHGRLRSFMNRPELHEQVADAAARICEDGDRVHDAVLTGSWPLPNLWMGVSVEDQKTADLRIPALLATPIAVRFLSCEPLLGPVDLGRFLHWRPIGEGLRSQPLPPSWAVACNLPALHWVITGGESGPKARPMEPAWARSLRDQCVAAAIPFFHKQNGEWAPNGSRGIGWFAGTERLVGPVLDDWGHREVIERVGKKAAGRLLDGREWNEFPATADLPVGSV